MRSFIFVVVTFLCVQATAAPPARPVREPQNLSKQTRFTDSKGNIVTKRTINAGPNHYRSEYYRNGRIIGKEVGKK